MTGTTILDLRGDWAALPTPAMRRAMAEAELGNDMSGEDPTVNRLQERVAELLGKQACISRLVSASMTGGKQEWKP